MGLWSSGKSLVQRYKQSLPCREYRDEITGQVVQTEKRSVQGTNLGDSDVQKLGDEKEPAEVIEVTSDVGGQ